MPFAENLSNCFFRDFTINTISENDKSFLYAVRAASINIEGLDNSINYLPHVYGTDIFSISISFNSDNAITYYSGRDQITEFINNLKQEYEYSKDATIDLEFRIDKEISDSLIYIYDLNVFIEYLSGLTISQCFAVFNRVLKSNDFSGFISPEIMDDLNTESICFLHSPQTIQNKEIARLETIEKIISSSYFKNIDDYLLAPNDFDIASTVSSKLKDLLDFRKAVLSVIALFDITSIQDNRLEYKLNGYKTFKGQIDLKSIPLSEIIGYFEIYKWVYEGGNLTDKLGLARNIISLYLHRDSNISLDKSVLQSIKSSYKVYEKQNIKQYIEIRNKLFEGLIDFSNRANKIVESFASNFQKSAFAVISFYISSFIIKAVSSADHSLAFTSEQVILSSSFIFCSLIYGGISLWEVLQQRQRFISSYNNLKARYSDILDSTDIERILNNDNDYNLDLDFIDKKTWTYSLMWLIFTVVIIITTVVIYYYPQFADSDDTSTLFTIGSAFPLLS